MSDLTITTPSGNTVKVYEDKYGIHARYSANSTAVVKGIMSHNNAPAVEAEDNHRQIIIPCSQAQADHVAAMLAERSAAIDAILEADAEYDRNYNRVIKAMEG